MNLTSRVWSTVAGGRFRLPVLAKSLRGRTTTATTSCLLVGTVNSNRVVIGAHYSTSCTTHGAEKEVNLQPWRDPAMRQYMFWNREESTEQGKYSYLIEFSPESVQTEARILSLSDKNNDPANQALHNEPLPAGASLLGVGTTVDDFVPYEQRSPNVLFVSPSCPHAAKVLPQVLQAFPSIQWVHIRSAGIDFIESQELIDLCNKERPDLIMTNAKGQFSSSLAEYVVMACSYFAKDLPRLMAQQKDKQWNQYNVEELRGKTLGIIGYGEYLRVRGRSFARCHLLGKKVLIAVALRCCRSFSLDLDFSHSLIRFYLQCDSVYGYDNSR